MQHSTEEKSHKMAEQLLALLDSLPVIPYTCKVEGNYGATYIGSNVIAVTGYQSKDFTSNSSFWADHIHPDDRERVFAKLPKLFETGYQKHEYRFRVADGTYSWFEDRLRLIKNQKREIDHIAGIWLDITVRKKRESQLQQSKKMEALGTFSKGISLEFNNILAVILGNAGMGLMEFSEISKEGKYFISISEAVKNAKNLVRQILSFTTIDTADFKLIDLSYVVKSSLSVMNAMMNAMMPENIVLKQKLLEDCPKIMADATQIHRTVLNLCSNAYHSMEETGGILEVTLTELDVCPPSVDIGAGRCLRLSVKDTGQGISPKDQNRIFEPFFTTKDADKGVGLGLSMVYGIVEKHRGEITVESELGKGTTVSIYFLTIETEIQEESKEKAVTKSKEGHIFVVEDDSSMLVLYKAFLEKQGYVVTVCSNVSDALTQFKKNPNQFDLVLSGQAISDMAGEQLVQEILAVRPDIPIVLSTGYNDVIAEKEVLAMGIRQYLMKPTELKTLHRAIVECLQGKNCRV